MRGFAFAVLLVGLLAVATVSAQTIDESPGIEALGWLVGTWQRTGLDEGRSGEERWWHDDDGLSGLGISRRGDTVVFEERLRIAVVDGAPAYIAEVSGNPAPVVFRLVDLDEHGFAFENPEHDFPQRIAYRREGERLHARISAGERAIDFHFQRQH